MQDPNFHNCTEMPRGPGFLASEVHCLFGCILIIFKRYIQDRCSTKSFSCDEEMKCVLILNNQFPACSDVIL